MTQVYVKYNPYRLETTIKINGRDVSTDSILYKVTKGKRLQEWISKFPKMLREELNTMDFSLEYCLFINLLNFFYALFLKIQVRLPIPITNLPSPFPKIR